MVFKQSLLKVYLLLFACSSQNIWADKLQIAATNWEPFTSSKMVNGGVLTELVQTAFNRGGHESDINWYPWVRTMRMVERDISDAAIGAYYSDERSGKFNYSDPIFSVDVGLVALKSLMLTEYDSLKSLGSYNFGIIHGWVYSPKFDGAAFLHKGTLMNQASAVHMLYAKRVDIVAVSIPVFKHEANLLSQGKEPNYVVLKPLLDSKPVHLIISKSNPGSSKLIKDFNSGLASIRADGTFQKILEKHRL